MSKTKPSSNVMHVKKRNGRLEEVDISKINKFVIRSCEGLEGVFPNEIITAAELALRDKIPTSEIDQMLILTTSTMISKSPNYSYAAARMLLACLYKEVLKENVDADTFDADYRSIFVKNIKKGIKEGIYTERLLEYDLKELSKHLDPDRDLLFKYDGLKNLYDRYFQKAKGKILETPQHFWMRVAMGVCLNEDNPTQRAIELYEVYSNHRAAASTPTLFNSGAIRSQLSSCYLSEIADSIDGIFDGLWQEALKSKYAGGLGFHMSKIRGTNSHIKGTNGKSSGIVPWLKVYEMMLLACDQAGRRKGSGCAYIEPWHLDVESFIELRKPNGEERIRTHDLNIALWCPDLFFERVENEGKWTLFCPSETPDLPDLYGEAFNKRYEEYEKLAEEGKMERSFTYENAKDLWRKIITCLFETSHPWITYKDASNLRHNNQHYGPVHGSNLCTEIILHNRHSTYESGKKTEVGETAVCNLSSINLARHMDENGKVDYDLLKDTINKIVRALDNVIDINFYPTEEAKKANMLHRPVGMGCMGWFDVLVKNGIVYDSTEAEDFVDELMEFISYHAIDSSINLAEERGRYETYEGSLWDQGRLPIDTWRELAKWKGVKKGDEYAGENAEWNLDAKMDWEPIRKKLAEHGIRNSHVMAIAPNASIAYILGCEQSIEPMTRLIRPYKNKSGNIMISNSHFVDDMKKEGLWCPQLASAVLEADGDVAELINIPDKYKELYKRAYDRDQFALIRVNARRQKWIDQAISFNLYNNKTSKMFINNIYVYANKMGLKTTYYFRNEAATKTKVRQEDKTPTAAEIQACSIDAMMNGGSCEMCEG